MGDIDDVGVVSRTAAALLAARARDEVYDVVGSRVHELSGARATVVTRLDEDDHTLRLARLLGFSGLQSLVKRIADIDYQSANIPLLALPPDEMKAFTSGRLVHLQEGLYNLSGRMLTRPVARAVEQALGIRSVWTMGFSWEDTFLGGVSLLLREDAQPERPALVEAIISLGSMALQRSLVEEKIEQVRKPETTGGLARRIAHDYNNLLTVIKGYAEVILDDLSQDSPLRSCAEEIKKSAVRAAELTSRLLSAARKPTSGKAQAAEATGESSSTPRPA